MKTIQEVFNLKVGDMIIKHIHTKHSNRNYWSARIRIENREYSVEIEEELTYDNKVYYMGYIKNTFLRKVFKNKYIVFEYSDYENTYRYILEAMIRVIKGDYSEIKGVGHCVAKPKDTNK